MEMYEKGFFNRLIDVSNFYDSLSYLVLKNKFFFANIQMRWRQLKLFNSSNVDWGCTFFIIYISWTFCKYF